ncbi:periplasmic heavy metal sensor [bacterium]|nr:periplasmic heavy metal sensor [bacterium]
MRRITVLTIGLLAFAASVMAQKPMGMRMEGQQREPGMHKSMGMHHNMLPNLTEDQQKKIETLRTKFMKDGLNIRNQIAEKRARLNTLRTADKLNTSEINKVIEDIGSLRTRMMKMGESHRQEVRALLTEEQRVVFDSMHNRMGKGCMKGRGRRR